MSCSIRAAALNAILTALLVSDAPLRAADAEFLRKLKETNGEYTKKLAKAKEDTTQNFEKAIQRIKTAKGFTEAARADKLNELKAAKDEFGKTSTFPKHDDYAIFELDYYLGVHAAYKPMAKLVEEAFAKANKSDDEKLRAEATKLKEEMERILPGKNRLDGGTRWHGTFTRGNNDTIPYHLAIHKKGDAGSFRGHVEDNPGVAGNWAYDLEGQTVGLAIEYAMTKSVRGKFTAVRVVGIVSGDRLIARVTQVAGKGNPTQGLVVLKLQKK